MGAQGHQLELDALIDWLGANEEFDALHTDLLDDTALAGLSRPDEDGAALLASVRAYQRVFRVTGDTEKTLALLRDDILSATHIARLPRGLFGDRYESLLGRDRAERIHRAATRVGAQVNHLWATAGSDVAAPSSRALRPYSGAKAFESAFEALPSYPELFGSLDYYGCQECGSILGAAAYLVDLLRIIDLHVTEPNKETIPKGMRFEERRPDLAEIPLTCEKTNTRVPYLQIVGERLLERAREKLSAKSDKAVWESLATGHYPFNLPLNLPLLEIRTLLAAVNLSLAEFHAAWGEAPLQVAREQLTLSPAQLLLVTTPAADEAHLAAGYGVETTAELESLKQVEPFLRQTGLSAAELTNLLTQDLTPEELEKGIAETFFVNRGLAARQAYLKIVEAEGETRIENLENDGFDRINRFLRLARQLGWSFAELDWALHAAADGQPSLEAEGNPAIIGLAGLKGLAATLELDPLDACGLVTQLKTYGSAAEPTRFDRVFNTSSLEAVTGGPYRPEGDRYNPDYKSPLRKWTVAAGDETNQELAGWLSGALGLSLDALRELATGVLAEAEVTLDVPTLSALRRHALLCGKLGTTVDRYLILLGAAGLAKVRRFEPEQAAALVAAGRWLGASPLDAYTLDYVLNGHISAYAGPPYKLAELPQWLESLWKLAATSSATDTYEQHLFAQLAILFGREVDEVEAAMPLAAASVTLPNPLRHWRQAFAAPAPGTQFAYLETVETLLGWASRWLVLAVALELPADLLKAVHRHPGGYGIAAQPEAISLQNVRDLQTFHRFMVGFQDSEGRLFRFAAARAKGEPATAQAKLLASVSGWDEKQVSALLGAVVPTAEDAPTALGALAACFGLAGQLGADINTAAALTRLAKPAEPAWATYEALASGLRAQITSLSEGKDREAKGARLEAEVDALKRDALLPLVRWKLHPGVVTDRDVYDFELIEVDTGPAVTISYIVEATNAAQLYLQRCRLRLEPGVEKLEIGERWWEWLMSFRTWQANREVFLYPENYLLPSVRGDKTSLFDELEGELLQSPLSDGSVEAAYEEYFSHFHSLAKLKPVDCHLAKVDRPGEPVDTLFLFARTETEPPTFYYCTLEEGVTWTEWVKIDVPIGSEFLTPVYAFHRLFVFWAELRKVSDSTVVAGGGTVQSATSVTYVQSVKYSFLDHRGKWVTPQTLVDERVVNYEPPAGEKSPDTGPFAPLLEMEDPCWTRVFVTRVGEGSLVETAAPPEFERISVFCGPFLRVQPAASQEPCPVTAEPKGKNEAETEFLRSIGDRTTALNSLIQAKESGRLPVTVPVNLNIDLQGDFVLSADEFLILSTEGNESTDPTIRTEIDSITRALTVVESSEVLYDEYAGQGTGTPLRSLAPEPLTQEGLEKAGIPSTPAAKVPQLLQQAKLLDASFFVVEPFTSGTDIATPLFQLPLSSEQLETVRKTIFACMGTFAPLANLSAANGRTLTVKNRPGSVQLDNGDESFLLTPFQMGKRRGDRAPLFELTSQALRAQRPALSQASFEVAGIAPESAKLALVALHEYGLLDEAGHARYAAAERSVKSRHLETLLADATLTKPQVTAVGNVLLNTPFAGFESLISPAITEPLAKKIIQVLGQYRLIDPSGRVTLPFLSVKILEAVLSDMIGAKELPVEEIPNLYAALLALTSPVEFAYAEGGPELSSSWDYAFTVTRTSTGAAERLSRLLFAQGLPGLLSLTSQRAPAVSVLPFDRFAPDPNRVEGPPIGDGAQVDFEGVYGLYYREVFFHVPMLVANSLSANQQFEAAERWFRYVFDPTAPEEPVTKTTFKDESREIIGTADSETIFTELTEHQIGEEPEPILDKEGRVSPRFTAAAPLTFLLEGQASPQVQSIVCNVLLNHQVATDADHYWRFWPFRNAGLETLRATLADSNPAIRRYENDPFDPFAIAALRIGAFEKATVIQYVKNLTAWGDSLFAEESFESITAATMLYVYALELLGERPVEVTSPPQPAPMTFAKIKEKSPHGVPTFLFELENLLPAPQGTTPRAEPGITPFNALDTYFCVPENEAMLSLWDTLEDRLFKIRNSMNIEGEVRELPLFAPPLNPLELVKAAAAGGGFLPAGDGESAPIPAYRFDSMLARAKAATGLVTELGSKLLAALERQDAESMELLRSTQEKQVLSMITTLKADAVTETEATLEGLRQSLASANNQVTHYKGLIAGKLNANENANLDAMAVGLAFNALASGLRAAAAIAYTIPQVGSPFAMTYGGVQVGSSLTAAGAGAEIGAEVSSFVAERAVTKAGYERREEDWELALKNAEYEVKSLERQIAAGEAQLTSARQDLALTKTEIAQNEKVYEYLEDKFTNLDLYQWLVGRIATVYFQAYRQAFELAQAAQSSYQFELGLDESFVSFGYWDNLHKGLMAGENLSFSLTQMESAYVAKNTRRLEIERTVSLALWDPNALWELRDTGECGFSLSEQLFDYDYPGLYNRQIKSVSVSIPAVLGPYEDFRAVLRQTHSAVATTAVAENVGYLLAPGEHVPAGVRENWAPRQQIAISHGSEDAGVFAFDFHDERYLPFEGTGAVSKWKLAVPRATNRFDLNAISDVIVTVRYTARDGGPGFAKEVRGLLKEHPLPGSIYLSLAQAYATRWNGFLANHSSVETQTLAFEVTPAAAANLSEETLTDVYLRLGTAGVAIPADSTFLYVSIAGEPEAELKFEEGGIGHLGPLSPARKGFAGAWKLSFDLGAMRTDEKLAGLLDADKKWLDPTKLLNAELILDYEGSVYG